ncbi:Rv3235 family protein [Streptomyces sp. NBC_01622]|uniref:Rv3235 family protein n=1 Tax=Streptomyces sp. NBC_01622 TaxID=2975903 RepID=UPI00386C36CE|nr:Rv3235 family protein [Streptomyces sp. NBC_01622]
MHKVMTRAAQHTPTRPPTRRDPRRPGTASPRGQGGGTSRTTTGEALPIAPAAVGDARLATPGTEAAYDATPAPRATSPSATAGRGAARTSPTAASGQGAARATPTVTSGQGSVPTALAPAPGRSTAPATSTPTAGRAVPRTVPAQAAPSRVPQPRPTDLFADRLLAVLSGQRPVHWMLRHTAGRAYDELIRLAEHGPLRATRGTRPVVRDIGYYVARPGAVEAFARISAGDQVRAMAFRLERGADLRWRCTAVERGGPRAPHTPDDD